LRSNENTTIGNTVLYGAISGKLFAAGQAGERLAVRNSGATVVVEGCGSNGCEYMTDGTAVILGPVGGNFAAGMTGGMAFIYDEDNSFPLHVNEDSIIYQRIEVPYYEDLLRGLITEHAAETQSRFACQILNDWDLVRDRFWQVVPKEMVRRLQVPISTVTESAAE
jgi:glutamate synthase (NADPH/NADH) large chain